MDEYLAYVHNSLTDIKYLRAIDDAEAVALMVQSYGESWRERYNLVRIAHI